MTRHKRNNVSHLTYETKRVCNWSSERETKIERRQEHQIMMNEWHRPAMRRYYNKWWSDDNLPATVACRRFRSPKLEVNPSWLCERQGIPWTDRHPHGTSIQTHLFTLGNLMQGNLFIQHILTEMTIRRHSARNVFWGWQEQVLKML